MCKRKNRKPKAASHLAIETSDMARERFLGAVLGHGYVDRMIGEDVILHSEEASSVSIVDKVLDFIPG